RLCQPAGDLQGGHAAQRTVEAPAVRHAVDVRAGPHRARIVWRARHGHEHVADAIGPHAQPGGLASIQHPGPGGGVGGRERRATHPSGRGRAELGQRFECGAQSGAVDGELAHAPLPARASDADSSSSGSAKYGSTALAGGGAVNRLTAIIRINEAAKPGTTGSMASVSPHNRQATVPTRPPSMATMAPSLVARRHSTPATTGTRKTAPMSALNSATMNCTSSPAPNPVNTMIIGTSPTMTVPIRPMSTRRSGDIDGRSTP